MPHQPFKENGKDQDIACCLEARGRISADDSRNPIVEATTTMARDLRCWRNGCFRQTEK